MALFEAKDIAVRTGILEGTEKGSILEVEFEGVHTHHWPHGRDIDALVQEEVRRIRPAAILFNFTGYHYEFGNEIGSQIMAAYIASSPRLVSHMAIVATGTTAKSLKNLFLASGIEKLFTLGFFEDVESGGEFLRRALERDVDKGAD